MKKVSRQIDSSNIDEKKYGFKVQTIEVFNNLIECIEELQKETKKLQQEIYDLKVAKLFKK